MSEITHQPIVTHQTVLLRTMDLAGWTLNWVDLDLTGSAPQMEIRATRHDGLWVRAYVDSLGRATVERFQRNLDTRQPMIPLINDRFIGRQRYPGGRVMLRSLCAYLVDNALYPVPLADMRRAWAALMQPPACIVSDLGETRAPAT